MFPDYLDGARVLFFTNYGDYAFHPSAEHIHYLAICQYKDDIVNYYLFSCNKEYDVIYDDCFWSVEACKNYFPHSESIAWFEKQ